MWVRWAWNKFLVPKTWAIPSCIQRWWDHHPFGGKNHNSLGNREFWGLQRMVWGFLECSFLRNIYWWGDSCREMLLGWISDPWGTSWQGWAGKGGPSPGFVVHNEKLLQDNSMRDQPKSTDPAWILNCTVLPSEWGLQKYTKAGAKSQGSSKVPLDLPQEGFSFLHPCSWMGVLHSQGYLPCGS